MSQTYFASQRDEALNIHFSLSGDPVIEAFKRDVDVGALRRNLSLTVEERMNNFLRGMEAMYEFQRAGEAMRAKERARNGQG